MERISDTEAEITLYGDIVARRPTDWWTGKPSEGNYIILSEFLNDLKGVEDVSKLTVRIHSAGGNAYDAITIHNRLKELPAEVTVIVDGIAMSGGSLIMCAADKVKVNPASLVMIHKCWSYVWDAMNADELRKMAESNDAIDRAQAAIYHAKTGLDEAEILTMMGNETYMTGQEAVDKGFADELLDGEAPDIAASADRHTLFYCGQPVWATPGRQLPDSIPISVISPASAAGINFTPVTTGNEGGTPMAKTLDELRKEYPDLTAQLEREARASAVAEAGAPNGATPAVPAQTSAPATPAATAATDPVQMERERIQAIDEIAPNILDKAMIEDAKYGHPCTAQELAFKAMKNQAAQGVAHLANAAADFQASGVAQVQTPAAPAKEADPDSPEAIAAQAKADVAAFEKMKEVR
jgi:ATP-dependent protease ClpP protease subunit